MDISFIQHSNWDKIDRALENMKHINDTAENIIRKYADIGLEALKMNTPKRTGYTADSWYYTITNSGDVTAITYKNSHVEKGVNIAILLQYGHGTRNGGWVEGIDYINPVLTKMFNSLANDMYKEITTKWQV